MKEPLERKDVGGRLRKARRNSSLHQEEGEGAGDVLVAGYVRGGTGGSAL